MPGLRPLFRQEAALTDRPILFSATMVRALLDGRKTQTRRTLSIAAKVQARIMNFVMVATDNATGRSVYEMRDRDGGHIYIPAGKHLRTPHFLPKIAVGDRLWVKEIWRPFSIDLAPWDIEVAYAADGEQRIIKDGEFGENDWTMPKAAKRGNVSSLFMPRWASRLTLIVTEVRVERLQDISEADAIAEGVPADFGEHIHGPGGYRDIWETINGADAWKVNPWVAAYTFTVHHGNIDEVHG